MLARILIAVALLSGMISHSQTIETVWAAEPLTGTYSLDDIVALAIARSPALAGAEGVLRQRHGQQVTAGAYPNPTIAGTAGRGAIRDPSTGVRITERTITLQQPLEWTGKRRARQDAADVGVEGARAALDEARLTLVADVKIAFYQLLFAQRDASLAEQNVATGEEVLRTVKIRVAAGEATSFDTMKANVEVQKAQKEIARTQSVLMVAKTRLNTLTAGGLGKQFSVQGDFQSPKPQVDLEQLVAHAFEHHPTMQRLAKLTEQADHTVQYERAARMPDVTLQGNYHREAGDESLIAGLSVPLPLWYRRQGEIETALGTQYRANADRRRAQQELEQAITQHAQEVRTAQDQLQVFETGLLKQAEQTLAVARTSFRQGAASLLDVLDAQRVYRQTVLEYAQVRADLSIALVRLERAAGTPL